MRYKKLTHNSEFSRAYTRGKSFVHPCLVLYVNKNRFGRVRIGLTATKKIGNAVVRNRAHRVMRAALDEVLPAEVCKTRGLDLVLVARGMTPRVKMQRVAEALAKLLQRAGVPCNAPATAVAAVAQVVTAPGAPTNAAVQANPAHPAPTGSNVQAHTATTDAAVQANPAHPAPTGATVQAPPAPTAPVPGSPTPTTPKKP